MKLQSVQLIGIRCFEDSGLIQLSPGCNIFVGRNNSGKSTILKAITDWQLGLSFAERDLRPHSLVSGVNLTVSNIGKGDWLSGSREETDQLSLNYNLKGDISRKGGETLTFSVGSRVFRNDWPNNFIVPFAARRKATQFDEAVGLAAQSNITGTFQNLYARVDRVAVPGTTAHDVYRHAIEEIVGVFIGTRSSSGGKEAGYWFDEDNFVTLDRMGDGVSEMVALIVELSLARNRVFVLEEPETNLHPKGLKALLALIRESAKTNQFLISTHSNVVVRELAGETTRIQRVYRHNDIPSGPSAISEIENTSVAHRDLLRELGHEFADFDLHEAWLILEEASAETIIREFLIPWFAPGLSGRLRTFSAGGVSKVEASIGEFQRLITFLHLEPVYNDRLWVRADGDEPGKQMIDKVRSTFPYLASPRSDTFSREQFEMYYPTIFQPEVAATLAIEDRTKRRAAKANLLTKVVLWSKQDTEETKAAWKSSADEQINLLHSICDSINIRQSSDEF